jgi:hypothetical protein
MAFMHDEWIASVHVTAQSIFTKLVGGSQSIRTDRPSRWRSQDDGFFVRVSGARGEEKKWK